MEESSRMLNFRVLIFAREITVIFFLVSEDARNGKALTHLPTSEVEHASRFYLRSAAYSRHPKSSQIEENLFSVDLLLVACTHAVR